MAILIICVVVLIIGKDAIRPFIVDEPSKIYEESDINVDAMFTLAESVRKIIWLASLAAQF